MAYKVSRDDRANSIKDPEPTVSVNSESDEEHTNEPPSQPNEPIPLTETSEPEGVAESLEDDFKPNVPVSKKNILFSEATATELETLQQNAVP